MPAIHPIQQDRPAINGRQLCFFVAFVVPVSKLLSAPAQLAEFAKGDLLVPALAQYLLQAAVLAVMRFVSYLGLWGNTNAGIASSSPVFLSIVVPSCIIVLFARYAILLPRSLSLPLRFQPALFLTLAGLFAVAMEPYAQGVWLTALSVAVQVSQLFAHLLFWPLWPPPSTCSTCPRTARSA